MGQTRRASVKMYGPCITCESNINGIGTCKAGYENFFRRRSKNSGCEKCTLWMKETIRQSDRLNSRK